MKTNPGAWQVYRIRIWAGLLVLLVLTLMQFSKVFRFGRDCGRTIGQPPLSYPAGGLSDWFATK